MMTEKMRVSASSVIRSPVEMSATPARSRREGTGPSVIIGKVYYSFGVYVASGVRRDGDRLGCSAPVGGLDREQTRSALARLGFRVCCLPLREPPLSSGAGAIVSPVGDPDACMRPVHRDLFRRRAGGARDGRGRPPRQAARSRTNGTDRRGDAIACHTPR